MTKIEQARAFAKGAHQAIAHRRKYTGECYTHHLAEVAKLVENYGGSDDMICAAWLHDVVEDTRISNDQVKAEFGANVAELVECLTDVSKPEDGNRAARKQKDAEHLSRATPNAQTIKLCDIISNTRSIAEHDPKFIQVYAKEMKHVLSVMNKGDSRLYELASQDLKKALA